MRRRKICNREPKPRPLADEKIRRHADGFCGRLPRGDDRDQTRLPAHAGFGFSDHRRFDFASERIAENNWYCQFAKTVLPMIHANLDVETS